MAVDRTNFLAGALAWIHGDPPPDACPVCGYSWDGPVDEALEVIRRSPARYAALLDGRDGMAPAADGGWNATAYLWHLADLARCWTERWVQVHALPGSQLVGFDPDELAAARNYRGLPTAGALWALEDAVATFVVHCGVVDHEAVFDHGDWGPGTVADAIRWLGHEFAHHELDVAARAVPPPPAGGISPGC